MTEENIDLALKLLPPQLFNTLYMVLASLFFAFLIGLPLGILLTITSRGHIKANAPLYKTLETIVNIGRSFPFAILIVALIPFTKWIVGTSLGTTAAIVPLTIGAAPFLARLIENALRKVDAHILEAALVMGATPKEIILKVLIPESLPALIESVTLTCVNLVGLSAMAGLVGGGGLGQVAIQYGYNRFNPFIMIVTVLLLISIVQAIQYIGSAIAEGVLKKRGHSLMVLLFLFLTSCSSDTSLKVVATPVPHAEMLEAIRQDLKDAGYDLKVIVVEDYHVPNRALADREVDANFFQHQPFLDEEIKAYNYPLLSYASIEIEPLGLYSKKVQSVDQLKIGATLAIPNDPTNEGRALLLLEKHGLIKLNPKSGLLATPHDITSNPKEFKFLEIDAAMLPRTLDEVDGALINTNFALEAKLSPLQDALLIEGKDSPYVNVLVIRKGDEERPDLKALKEAMTSPKMRAFILNRYQGALLPAF